MTVIIAMWAAENWRITVPSQSGQKSLQDPMTVEKKLDLYCVPIIPSTVENVK
jgi:hypothetical protein